MGLRKAKLLCTCDSCNVGTHLGKPTSVLHLQKQQQAKEAEALVATASATPLAVAEATASMPAATGPQKNNLVHAWVMVLSGKREVYTNSSGGCVYDDSKLCHDAIGSYKLNAMCNNTYITLWQVIAGQTKFLVELTE